ncbi:MAG: radical SAM protein [Firmicutes bacterium]|nr:radical SAM protein [Bacillota bacterium]
MSYDDAPHVVTWELTRACQLHCRHCRAQAIPRRHPQELTLDDMLPVLDDLATQFERPPILVFTGGDPLERPDLEAIIGQAVSRRLITALAPSVTPRLTPLVLQQWHDLGVHSVSLSLDGADAPTHDKFRGVRNTFVRTVEMAHEVVRRGLALQINTSVSRQTVEQIPAMAKLVEALGAQSWELFFVIPTGRARLQDTLGSQEIEEVLRWLTRFQPHRPMRVTTVGAPQWARVRHEANPLEPPRVVAREARGFAFIDHVGEVYPSGYLPVSGGNVRRTPFSAIYRHSPLFQQLRDPDHLNGPCGHCAYRHECGGSRARAYAVTQNLVASDPGCLRASG